MKWISALNLEQWADRIGAREEFPELVRDLITASANDISEVRIPGGDKGQVHGFDGWLEAGGMPPFVPAGRSIWEFGVSANPAGKFESDYDKRVKEIPAAKRQQITFVFVTPRTWDNPRKKLPDFVEEYRNRADFSTVHYYDGVQLEDWLQRCAAVGARYARTVLGRIPQMGARSTDEFWGEYARRFHPTLTEDIVLCARADQAQQVITHLLGKPGSLVFLADGPDEVSAVAVAAIRKAPAESRAFLEARTLVIDAEEAGRELSIADRYGFIVSPSANKISGMLSSFGPTVSGLNFNISKQKYLRLERPSRREMTEALRTMGFTEEKASLLALRSGRSLTILERHIPAASFDPPKWVSEGEKLIPALLAGGWDSKHDGDQAILTELSGGKDYLQIEAQLRPFLNRHDSPLDREGGIWKLRAPVDAFVNLCCLLGAEHLVLLTSVVGKIFAASPPEIVEDKFAVSKAPYSSWLREGVANMLLMLAALHEEVALDVGRDPALFVDDLVGGLPGLSDDYRMIQSLEQQLPALMEAAPDPLLSALEQMLGGNKEKIAPIFVETPNFGMSRNKLPNLLWALEMLAWDPDYLLRVSLVLARLAEIDPGGRSSNRPIGSLRDIFVAWNPGTNAPLASRLKILDVIVEQIPGTGWELLTRLLPKMSDTKGPTQRPRFREAGASERESLTHRLVDDTYDAIVDRVFTLLGEQSDRWLVVLESFPQFSRDRKKQFLNLLEERALRATGEDKVALRHAIERMVDRHARFRNANWALPDGDLQRLMTIAGTLESEDPIDRARLLFEDWLPVGVADRAEAEKVSAQRRRQEVAKLASSGGAKAILELAGKVKLPQFVATASAEGISDEKVLIEILDSASTGSVLEDFVIALSGALRWTRGEAFEQRFLTIARERGWSDAKMAVLLLAWPEVPATWHLVEMLGSGAKDIFWRRRRPRYFDGPRDQLFVLVNNFLTVGRPGAALEAAHGREDELDWPTITLILKMRVRELNERGEGALDSYYIEELFEKLRQRTDVPRLELAQWEYAYFPVLEHHESDLVLFDLMASDPEFFVSILKDVFVEDGTNLDEQETTEEQRMRGNASHRILVAFNRAPGQSDGVVDSTALDRWVDGMIDAATRERRLNVIYSYIGRSLAHSAEKDGIWPQPAVAQVIERLSSDDLERGMMIERFNMRGVYTKALFEGGKQERALAQQYRNWAIQTPASFLRTRAMLNAIANDWEADAKRADEEAARDQLRFE